MERPPRARRAGRALRARLADGGGEVHGGGAGRDRRACWRGTGDAGLGEIDRERRLRKPAAIGTRPRLGANRDAARVQGADVRTAQVAAIDQQFGERSMRGDGGRQQRQRRDAPVRWPVAPARRQSHRRPPVSSHGACSR